MDTKPLGKSGVELPEIGLGTWEFSGEAAVIHRAIELGSFLLDTAESYGTEERVGKAIAGRRDEVFLATKVSPWHFHHADVLAACDRSLKALGVDTIDLYQLHAPSKDVPIEETMGAMADLVAAGKVLHVGVSNFNVREMEAAEAALGPDLVVENQIKYSLFDHQFADTVIPYCEERDIMVLAYSSLEQGAFQREMRRNKRLVEVMGDVCAETGKTAAQVLLNWTLRSPVVITIPKTNTLSRVDENCAASGWRLTDAQWHALTDAAGSTHSAYWWR
ncbi:MAG: aldo/keto reductase [Chloroflexota bacterium]|nr:aldo/keto reductase [Chloroflexota bacterium]MDE2884204.1 aldo/keto reductase [Chloroflexota bacterium]